MTAAKKSPAPKPVVTKQSAKPLGGIARDDLNDKEHKVLGFLGRCRSDKTIVEIAAVFDNGRRSLATRRSWVRNALRRLVRERFVVHATKTIGDGRFRVAPKGRVRRAKTEAKAA